MAEIRLDSAAFFHNIDTLSAHVGTREKLAVVIKDNAYGHGLLEMAKLAHKAKIKSAFVKNSAEAVAVAPYFSDVSALYGEVEISAPQNVNAVIHSLDQLEKIPQNRSFEIKIDTGMYRNGISIDELPSALLIIKNRALRLRGVMAHNGYGDELGSEFFTQQRRFSEVKNRVQAFAKEQGIPGVRFHSLSSSGALRSKEIDDDIVRFGIAIYGYHCADSTILDDFDLRPVLSLYAHKITTKNLKRGARIGYGGASELMCDSYVSTYDIGYGDGFFRLNENHTLNTGDGEMILPRVSMDCISVISKRDEICLMRNAREVATVVGTIPYEVLTRLSPTIRRVVI